MSGYWMTPDGYVHREVGGVLDHPVVVIDPEDVAAVDRLLAAYYDEPDTGDPVADMQAALRSLLAPPRPPKPVEPTGLGAVVEDADGTPWINVHPGMFVKGGDMTEWAQYADLAIVRVLSEGVTA